MLSRLPLLKFTSGGGEGGDETCKYKEMLLLALRKVGNPLSAVQRRWSADHGKGVVHRALQCAAWQGKLPDLQGKIHKFIMFYEPNECVSRASVAPAFDGPC